MKILVCIKQVPDMESRFRVNSAGDWFEETDLAFRINEYDEYAVEQAVLLKEQLGDVPEITVLSIGPGRVNESIRKALAMGCDCGVHIEDSASHQKDPWQIAETIVDYARDKGFDLIFTGMQSQDRGSAQVGLIIAELMGYACATTIVGFNYDNGLITAKRELEGGTRAVVKFRLPAVVTCQLGLNVPRYPTLPNIMKSKRKEILPLVIADVSSKGLLSVTSRVYSPKKKGCGIVLEGEVSDLVEQLVTILKMKTAVLR